MLRETLAQPVEHTPFKRRVEGSNPSCLTNIFNCESPMTSDFFVFDYALYLI